MTPIIAPLITKNLPDALAKIKQIERAKQEWEVTADALPQLVCLLDKKGHILRANRTLENWQLGKVNQVRGLSLHNLLHPHCQLTPCYFQGFWEHAWNQVKLGQAVVEQVQDKQLNRYLEIQLQPLNISKNENYYYTHSFAVIIIQDITANRAMQQNQELTSRLTSLEQMAAGFSHYFNNILTTIIGFSELLQLNTELSEAAKSDLSHIVRQGHRAAQLTRQILDFSRQSTSQKQPLQLADLLTETLQLLEETAPPHITLKLHIESGDFTLNADANQLRQALLNLTFNAWQAMPDGGVVDFHLYRVVSSTITSPLQPKLAIGDWIGISISDNGLGIDLEHQRHLFEPFFTTKELGKGMGLGLPQVYGILKQHSGEIEIKSEIGNGTTVYLYLPSI